ncbi:50S ribosomal protein L10 [Candidatus Saccharibacteria bacterium]|nr:50S ribosomal protein L10 [Candidatus Saccharibacteria bacterium]
MAISKDKKNTLVADLTELLNDSKMVVYAKYEGLTVAELQELRKMAREAGVKIKVVKNRLVKVAMKEIATYKDTETSGLTGQLLYALGTDEDFDAAKVLTKFAKTHAKMELIGGFNGEGETLSKEEVTTLGNHPTKNELIAQVVDTLLSGINGIVSGLENKPETVAPAEEKKEEASSESKAEEPEKADNEAESSEEAESDKKAEESAEKSEESKETEEKATE